MRIPPEVGQTVFRLALFIIVMALMVLLWARPAPGTPGFVITVLTLLMGTGFGAVVVLLARFSQRKR